MEWDFVWFRNTETCDIAQIWSMDSQFLLIKITFIRLQLIPCIGKHQLNTDWLAYAKENWQRNNLPTLPRQLKYLIMGFLTFSFPYFRPTLSPQCPQHSRYWRRLSKWKNMCQRPGWVLVKAC